MEDIVFACFLLFPQKFALKKYPRWPDSAVVSRRLSDRRNKGYIAVNIDPGFKLTAKGLRLAKKIAKVLGSSIAKRAAKAPPSQPKERAGIPARKVKSVKHKEKIIELAKVAQVLSSQPKTHTATPTRKTKIVQKKKTTSPTPIGKAQISRLTQVKKTAPFKPVKKAQSVQPVTAHATTPLKNIKHLWTKKTKPFKPAVQPGKLEKTQLTQFKKASLPVQSNMPKEVKIRAGKFVHLMEKSDAYIHYRKNGKNSNISEFDFRSLLLCTMESSRETLARNVELFKGYAGVHDRQDLVTFLTYCEEYFFSLLKPHSVKKTGRKKYIQRKAI